MNNSLRFPISREILEMVVLMVNGTLLCFLLIPLCALFACVCMLWALTDYILMKLEKEECL